MRCGDLTVWTTKGFVSMSLPTSAPRHKSPRAWTKTWVGAAWLGLLAAVALLPAGCGIMSNLNKVPNLELSAHVHLNVVVDMDKSLMPDLGTANQKKKENNPTS